MMWTLGDLAKRFRDIVMGIFEGGEIIDCLSDYQVYPLHGIMTMILLAALSSGCSEYRSVAAASVPSDTDIESIVMVYRDKNSLDDAILKLCGGTAKMFPRKSDIDWQNEIAVVISPGARNSSGYTVSIDRIERKSGKTIVYYRINLPPSGKPVTLVVECPYLIAAIKKTDEPIELIEVR